MAVAQGLQARYIGPAEPAAKKESMREKVYRVADVRRLPPGLAKQRWDVAGAVQDSDDFNTVVDGAIEDDVVPDSGRAKSGSKVRACLSGQRITRQKLNLLVDGIDNPQRGFRTVTLLEDVLTDFEQVRSCLGGFQDRGHLTGGATLLPTLGELALDLVHVERCSLSAIKGRDGLLDIAAKGLVPFIQLAKYTHRRNEHFILRLVLAAGDRVVYELPNIRWKCRGHGEIIPQAAGLKRTRDSRCQT